MHDNDQPMLVIGIDTHKQTHVAAAVGATTGGVIEQVSAPASPAGYGLLLEAANRAGSTVGAGGRVCDPAGKALQIGMGQAFYSDREGGARPPHARRHHRLRMAGDCSPGDAPL
jgi:hypothetical protein